MTRLEDPWGRANEARLDPNFLISCVFIFQMKMENLEKVWLSLQRAFSC